MCHQIKPYPKTKSRKAISKSKLYLFDVSVANYLAKRGEIIRGGELYGPVFEHFIINEIRAYLNYHCIYKELYFWRTTDQVEVDCIISHDSSRRIVNDNIEVIPWQDFLTDLWYGKIV
jgi:predicted AAA+ superfamily ATPase